MALPCLVMPLVVFVVARLLVAAGLPVPWTWLIGVVAWNVALGMAWGVALGVAGGVTFGMAGGVTLGMNLGFELGVVGGVAFAAVVGVTTWVVFFVVGGTEDGSDQGLVLGLVGAFAGVVEMAVMDGMWGVVDDGFGAAGAVAMLMFSFRVPIYLVEAAWTLALAVRVRSAPERVSRLVWLLPLLHHDVIFFPLPGLQYILIEFATRDPDRGFKLIERAGARGGQQRQARLALIELQARSLEDVTQLEEDAAQHQFWVKACSLQLRFLPRLEGEEASASPFFAFQTAARDMLAARESRDHRRRRHSLERAHEALQGFITRVIGAEFPTELEKRLRGTARAWLDIIDAEVRALEEEERTRPQIDRAFEAGPPLRPKDATLFKGRSELIRLIDHDLADDRRAPLVLIGQRRMGKTSLVHMLQERLGTGTRLVILNFQGLSGHPHQAHPHRWFAEALVAARPELPKPPTQATWVETLAWLREAEATLGRERVLVAIDEVEGLQRGIEEGWSTPAFLDFLRAAGDQLTRVRLLLVSAHPFHRLGRSWTDRLINVVQRNLTYLLPDEAADLVRNPTPGFPDIYPPGGVERIVRETQGHPYLVQLVCDALVRDLNSRGYFKAEAADLDRAFDRALNDQVVFRELWSSLSDEERALLRRLVKDEEPGLDSSAPLRELVQQGYVEAREGRHVIAVPLFRRWIRETGV